MKSVSQDLILESLKGVLKRILGQGETVPSSTSRSPRGETS